MSGRWDLCVQNESSALRASLKVVSGGWREGPAWTACRSKRSGQTAPWRGGHSAERLPPAGERFYSASAARKASWRARKVDLVQQVAAVSSCAEAAAERGSSFTEVKLAGAHEAREPRMVGADRAGTA